jgi:DNA-binding transcriptional ArsR family regulator
LRVEVVARPALELVLGLYALTAVEPRISEGSWVPTLDEVSLRLRKAIGGIGEDAGERWVHLAALVLDLEHGSVDDLIARLETIDGVELRRYLIGVDVPSWERHVERSVLERAAAGEAAAAEQVAAEMAEWDSSGAFRRLLGLTPAETKRRILRIVRLFASEVFAEREPQLVPALERAAAEARAKIEAVPPERAVLEVTGGYEYVREAEFDRVVLIPHLAAPPWLLLIEHRDARVIGYPAVPAGVDSEKELRERLLRLGRALSDEKRIEILRQLGAGEATMNELAEAVGLAKSTIHHHLAQLREAGLVRLRGNARGYWFSISPEGRAASVELLGGALGEQRS